MQINKLPDYMMEQVLGYPHTSPNASDRRKIKATLEPFGLDNIKDNNDVVELPIPPSFGTWQEECDKAVQNHARGILDKLEAMAGWDVLDIPTNFYYTAGWQGWHKGKWQPVAAPVSGKTFIQDTETVEINGFWYPTCAVAISNRGWMLWVTDWSLLTTYEAEDGTEVYDTSKMPTVIPFGTNNVMVGWNVSYDRSYLDVEYRQEDTGNRFFDLMSAWIVTHGLSNQQRPMFLGKSENRLENPEWCDWVTTNGLQAVYEHFFEVQIDKGVRDDIVKQGITWVNNKKNMQSVIRYCCEDVRHTLEVYKRLYPIYLNYRPSEVSQAGAVLLGSCWLPLSAERFPKYYEAAEAMYQEIAKDTNEQLMAEATRYFEDSQGWTEASGASLCLDWTIVKSGVNKDTPAWYRKVVSDYKKGKLTLCKRFVPVVLGITWRGEQVLWDNETHTWYTKGAGWLPHPEERGKNVTNIFAKGFVSAFDDGILGTTMGVQDLLAAKMSSINWLSLRKRVADIHTESPDGFPVTLPQLKVNGTITGRCTDNTWLVASNPKKTRIGTELKSMVSPPKGYVFIGADIDSEEAWLAGILGDKYLGFNASSPMGMINVAGQKKDTLEASTDIHSMMAKETKMTRDATKTRVYGAIYGQGIKGDANGLLKNIVTMTLEEALENAKLFSEKFKGVKKYQKSFSGKDTVTYSGGLASESFNIMEAIADSKQPKTPLLGALMSRALAGIKDFKPSRVNWTIQSSGVDFRDMLVLLARHFFDVLEVQGRLMITIHDEIRTMVVDEPTNITLAIYALQLAHLYCRAAFIDCLGLDCIPAGVAWFSAVDVDAYCLRKDPFNTQVTPSQPLGLPKGYTVSPKELLDRMTPSIFLAT